MRIDWAVFGERSGGHALLAASGDISLAGRITQYTDRPGDPPFGLDWGPVVSGFPFVDQYVLLTTLPDTQAGRAGMVRSYAAVLPISSLSIVNTFKPIFDKLPSDLVRSESPLAALEIRDVDLAPPSVGGGPGLAQVARRLCSSPLQLPLVWTAPEPYFPMVDALWGKLPPLLRRAFAFSFQFAPEHRLPVAPTIVATPPELTARWQSYPILSLESQSPGRTSSVERWLIGAEPAAEFQQVLAEYEIDVGEFSSLGILSSLVDLVERLPDLSFAEARRAVVIVAKYSRSTRHSGTGRPALFKHLASLVKTATADDLTTLRNLDADLLADLVPNLQTAMRQWADRISEPVSEGHLGLFAYAVASPTTWWSLPFVAWLREYARGFSPSPARTTQLAALSRSVPVFHFLAAALPHTDASDIFLASNLPPSLEAADLDTVLDRAKKRQWMRLHAMSILRTGSPTEAIVAHAAVAGDADTGLTLIATTIGLPSITTAACADGSVLLVRFVGRALAGGARDVLDHLGSDCPQRNAILTAAVETGAAGPGEVLRDLVVSTFGGKAALDIAGIDTLFEACSIKDPALLLALPNGIKLLDSLNDLAKTRVKARLNAFVLDEIMACRKVTVGEQDALQQVLDSDQIVTMLSDATVELAIKVGVFAFRSLPMMSDEQCRRWLVNLFTRTYRHDLTTEDGVEIANLLIAADYPRAAQVVKETVEQYRRDDVAPILQAIRFRYQVARAFHRRSAEGRVRLPKVLIATALPLERDQVIKELPEAGYDPDLLADVAPWPSEHPIFEVYLFTTGAGNLSALTTMLNALGGGLRPQYAFFVGVSGGVKDSDIGDVVYSTKVYYVEGGKEEKDGYKARPASEETSEELVQLAHRVAGTPWQPAEESDVPLMPKATPAIMASSENVLTTTVPTAENYQRIKTAYNDTQVVDMEAYGFLKAMRTKGVRHSMVIRGVSDTIANKAESDARGNQPLAARNAVAFLFAMLDGCSNILQPKKGKRRRLVDVLSRRRDRG